jgi:hypothetical protein
VVVFSSALYSHDVYVRTLGGPGSDYGASLIRTQDGGVCAVGWTLSYGAGENDLLLVKFDGAGEPSWSRAVGGADHEYGRALIETHDGGIVALGRTRSFGAGGFDVLLLRFDAQGTLLWTRTLGGASDDYGEAVVEAGNGDLVVAGYTQSFGMGSWDVLLARFDSLGAHQWTTVLGEEMDDRGISLIELENGDLAVAGRSTSYGLGGADVLLMRFAHDGTNLWTRAVGGTGHDYGRSVTGSWDGGLIVAGYTSSFGAGAGGWDICLSSFTGSGVHLWTRTLGGELNEYTRDMIRTQDHGYAVLGYTSTFGLGLHDVLLVKYDSSGSRQWSWVVGDSMNDYGWSVCDLPDGSFVTTGGVSSYGSGSTDLLLASHAPDGYTCAGSAIDPTVLDWYPITTEVTPTVTDTQPDVSQPDPVVTDPVPTLTPVCHELCGDANGSADVTSADGYHILNYFGSGPLPVSCWTANVTGDTLLTTADGFHLLNYLGVGPDLDCAPCEF